MLTRFQIAEFVRSYPYFKDPNKPDRLSESDVNLQEALLRGSLDESLDAFMEKNPIAIQKVNAKEQQLISQGMDPKKARETAIRIQREWINKFRKQVQNKQSTADIAARERVQRKSIGRRKALGFNQEYDSRATKGEVLDSTIGTLKNPNIQELRRNMLIVDRDRQLKTGELQALLEDTRRQLLRPEKLSPKEIAKLQARERNVSDKLNVIRKNAPTPEEVVTASKYIAEKSVPSTPSRKRAIYSQTITSPTEALKQAIIRIDHLRTTAKPAEQYKYPGYERETRVSQKTGRPYDKIRRVDKIGRYVPSQNLPAPENRATTRTLQRLQQTQAYAQKFADFPSESFSTTLQKEPVFPAENGNGNGNNTQTQVPFTPEKTPRRKKSKQEMGQQSQSKTSSPKQSSASNQQQMRNIAANKVRGARRTAAVGAGLLGTGAAIAGGKYLYDRNQEKKKEKEIRDKLMYSSYM